MRQKESVGYNPLETRRLLVDAAAEEIWRMGFRAASLSAILQQAGVTKGALYHHFKNKQELGYAVVDELLRESIRQTWVVPLQRSHDPIETLVGILQHRLEKTVGDMLKYGCPLANLAYEMSPWDEGFRQRVAVVFGEWQDALAQAFQRGQEKGLVSSRMNPRRAASFMVSAMEGAICTAKSLQDRKVLEDCFAEFVDYIHTYRSRPKE